jgi:glycosyltransferase involved in cell wall biosynthesis
MSSHPKLSLITTLYNCEEFIEQSLQSVLDQTYADFEWIILNDGSTDGTWDIATSMLAEDERVIFVDSRENKKIPARRNDAITLAKGEYVAIVDGDDINLHDRFEKQVAFLNSHADIWCVGAHALLIDHDDKYIESMNYPPALHADIVSYFLRQCRNPIIDPTTMFRKKDFDELGGYTLDRKIYTVPDMDLWCRAIVMGKKMSNLPRALLRYRRNMNGMTQKHNEEMIKAHMTVWRKFAKDFQRITGGPILK